MDPKDLLPIAGVAVGWLLSSIGAAWKARDTNRQNVGRLLTKLVSLHQEFVIVMRTTEGLKDRVASWPEYEDVRADHCARHLLSRENVTADVRVAIDAVAGVYPILCVDLYEVLERLEMAKKLSLRKAAAARALYVVMLAAHETFLEALERKLRRAALVIAGRHSPITFVRAFFRLQRVSRITSSPNAIEKTIAEAHDAFLQSKLSKASHLATPSDGAARSDPPAERWLAIPIRPRHASVRSRQPSRAKGRWARPCAPCAAPGPPTDGRAIAAPLAPACAAPAPRRALRPGTPSGHILSSRCVLWCRALSLHFVGRDQAIGHGCLRGPASQLLWRPSQ